MIGLRVAEVSEARQARRVRQQVSDRQGCRVAGWVLHRRELRQVANGRIVEREPPLISQLQESQAGEGLGDGPDSINGIGVDGRLRLQILNAEALLVEELTVDDHADREAGKLLRRELRAQLGV